MKNSTIYESKNRIETKINNIQKRMENPSFIQELSVNGHIIASEFLESVKLDLNWIEMKAGRNSADYIELSEAIAIIGSGCLRWATGKTRVLMSASDFMRNKNIYSHEKIKIEMCKRLSYTFSHMEMRDNAIISKVIEVDRIVAQLNSQFQKKSGCYIASIVYKSPFAPEVILFKEYRDNVLKHLFLGRIFISFYYFFAPTICKLLVKQNRINYLIKHILLDPIYSKLSESDNVY